MLLRLTMILTLASIVSLANGAIAQEVAQEATPGNPPRILIAEGINEQDQLVLVKYQTIYIGFQGDCYNHRTLETVSLKDVRICTADGEELAIEEARKHLSKEMPILATSWKKEIPSFYRPMISDDALLFIFPRQAPEWKDIQDPTVRVR